jgi:hypothetical protein
VPLDVPELVLSYKLMAIYNRTGQLTATSKTLLESLQAQEPAQVVDESAVRLGESPAGDLCPVE